MVMKFLPVLFGTLLFLVSCSSVPSTTTDEPSYSVEGLVHAGPTCPTAADPPAPGCEDRAVEGARLRIVDSSGRPVAEVTTDASGHFTVELPAGEYTLLPQPVEGLLGTAPEQNFDVPTSGELDVAYDTGIR